MGLGAGMAIPRASPFKLNLATSRVREKEKQKERFHQLAVVLLISSA
jgi:hypothetical protein